VILEITWDSWHAVRHAAIRLDHVEDAYRHHERD